MEKRNDLWLCKQLTHLCKNYIYISSGCKCKFNANLSTLDRTYLYTIFTPSLNTTIHTLFTKMLHTRSGRRFMKLYISHPAFKYNGHFHKHMQMLLTFLPIIRYSSHAFTDYCLIYVNIFFFSFLMLCVFSNSLFIILLCIRFPCSM